MLLKHNPRILGRGHDHRPTRVFKNYERSTIEKKQGGKKMESQTKLDIGELLKGDVAEKARISSVEIKRADEVFGEKAINPDNLVIKLETSNGSDLTIGLPKGLGYENGEWKVLNKLQLTRSIRNKASKFGAFLRKYNTWPNVGAEVETDLDDSGFARIVI